MKINVIKSQNNDVFENISLEFSMFKNVQNNFKDKKISSVLLFLWTNDKTIVLGRNQDIYKECNLEYCAKNNIKISRRFTGGGAVYHDKGNLNFTIIATSDIYDKKKNFEIIKKALSHFGIKSELSGRNDITIEGRKFSGSAYYNTKYASMHHGTLLINTDENIITNALTPDIKKLKSKGVDSVRSRIVNLSSINDKINVKTLQKAIISEFEKEYKSEEIEFLPQFSPEEFEKNVKLLKSTDFIYNSKLESNIELENRFDWGNFSLQLSVEGKTIKDLEIYSDTLFFDIPIKLKKCLINKQLNTKDMDLLFKDLLNTTTNAVKNKIYLDIREMILKISC